MANPFEAFTLMRGDKPPPPPPAAEDRETSTPPPPPPPPEDEVEEVPSAPRRDRQVNNFFILSKLIALWCIRADLAVFSIRGQVTRCDHGDISQVNEFRVLNIIGSGAQGTVFRVVNELDNGIFVSPGKISLVYIAIYFYISLFPGRESLHKPHSGEEEQAMVTWPWFAEGKWPIWPGEGCILAFRILQKTERHLGVLCRCWTEKLRLWRNFSIPM